MKSAIKRSKAHAEAVVSDHRPILSAMLGPKSVALIGASEKPGSVGHALLENLQSFRGRVFPINPNHARLLGQKAFPTIRDTPQEVDLAVIATPAATVPGIVAECAAADVKVCCHHLGWIQGMWACRGGTRRADSQVPRKDADHWAKLCRRDAAAHRLERDVCKAFGVEQRDELQRQDRQADERHERHQPDPGPDERRDGRRDDHQDDDDGEDANQAAEFRADEPGHAAPRVDRPDTVDGHRDLRQQVHQVDEGDPRDE